MLLLENLKVVSAFLLKPYIFLRGSILYSIIYVASCTYKYTYPLLARVEVLVVHGNAFVAEGGGSGRRRRRAGAPGRARAATGAGRHRRAASPARTCAQTSC